MDSSSFFMVAPEVNFLQQHFTSQRTRKQHILNMMRVSDISDIYIYLFYAHILNRYRKSERKKTRALYCAAKLNALKAGCKDWKSQCRATVMTMCTLEQAIALKSPANK